MAKAKKDKKELFQKLFQKTAKEDAPPLDLSEEDLLGLNVEDRPSLLFLGTYSKEQIQRGLEKYGVWEELERRGFGNLRITMDTRDPYRQRLAIHSVIEKLGDSLLLAEIVVKRDVLTLTPDFDYPYANRSFDVLVIEWLALQDPRLAFTEAKPRLPGQQYPGLGMSREVLTLLTLACKRLNLAGIINVPQYFHNAHIYSRVASFIDPVCEGKRLALTRDLLSRHSLAKVSWAIDWGCVRENEQSFQWFTSQQLVPLCKEIRTYFSHPEFTTRVKAAEEQYRYVLDEACWEEKGEKEKSGYSKR